MKEMKSTLEKLGFKGKPLPMLTEFLTEIDTVKGEELYDTYYDAFHMVVRYKNFITQPFTKGQFVPCDLDGNVLSEPLDMNFKEDISTQAVRYAEIKQYQQALDRCIFKSDTSVNIIFMNNYKTIEQAINDKVKLILK